MKEFDKLLDKLIAYLGDLYKKAPDLPKNIRDFIVTVIPWFSLVVGILGVLGMLAAIGALTVFSPAVVVDGGIGTAAGLSLAVVVGLIESVITLIAVPSLMKRKAMGWRLLFISQALGVVSTILTVTLGGLIGAAIGFYILYQIKLSYK